MPDSPNKLSQFWQELKRRKVVRVITVYAAAAFVILELVSIIVEPLKLPDWTLGLVIILLVIGFFIAVILSWIYDVTPGGLQKTGPTDQETKQEETPQKIWKILVPLSLIVIAAFIIFYFAGGRGIKRNLDISRLEKSIAVLPFVNWSVEEEHAHLGNALANEIITELYKVHDFHVISYTSAARYQDPGDLTIPQIAEELGANFIIEGTVERQNDEVSIHVQVIEAENDDHIWAHEFKGKWKDIFQIQDEIALSVAEQLEAVLTEKELADIDKLDTSNPEAYDHFLKGLTLFETNVGDLTNSAIRSFEKAISLDSSFAQPWTYLSMCYWRQTRNTKTLHFQLAKQANLRALELNPDLSISNMNMAELLDNEYNFIEAERWILRGLELDPEHVYVLRNAGRFYTLLGQHDRSISYCRQALENDPVNPTATLYLMLAYFYSGQYEEAKAILGRYHNFGLRRPGIHFQLLLVQGMFDRIENDPIYTETSVGYLTAMAALHLKNGEKELAIEMMQKIKALEAGYHYYSAMAYAYSGNGEKVCELLESSYEAGEAALTYLKVDPAFYKYKDELRFQAILKKMNYPE